MKRKNEEKKPLKSKPKAKIILLIAFLLIYLPSLVHWAYGKGINKDLVRNGVIEDSINSNGYIIRNEELLVSPFEGLFIPAVDEGEKVPVNFRVATVLKKSALELLDSKNEIDLKIIKYQNSKNEAQQLFAGDVRKIENEIALKVAGLISESNKNTFYNVRVYRKDINELVKKKSDVLSGLNSNDVYINELKNERMRIENQIQANTRDIYSDKSGIISYVIDGFEELLNVQGIDKITPEVLEKIEIPAKTFSDNNVAVPGKPFAKVIDNTSCYVAVPLEASQAERLKKGEKIKLRFNDISRETYGEIAHVSSADGKGIVVALFNRYISELSDRREVNLDLIKSSTEGLKVQAKSLQDLDILNMKAKIVLVKGSYSVIEDVTVEALNREYAIISSEEDKVNLYDTYVVNPGDMAEGQVIN
jgi:putative membrane fusion protein